MDELIDIVNLAGEATGNACLKSFAHQNGILHASVHIWFYNQNGEVLIQKRASNKEIYPNLWDVSVAGHIASKESVIAACIRETLEEINLAITKKELLPKGIWEEKHQHENGLIDHEIHHLYIAKLKVPLEQLTPQASEVRDLKLVSIDYLEANFFNKATFVPHDAKYYKHIIKILREIIKHEK